MLVVVVESQGRNTLHAHVLLWTSEHTSFITFSDELAIDYTMIYCT
jgi:hypothetical protein